MKDKTLSVVILAIFSFSVVHPVFAQSNTSTKKQVCICDCAYPPKQHIRAPGYFEHLSGTDCSALNGQACVAALRKERYKGLLISCQNGPRPVSGGMELHVGTKLTLDRSISERVYQP